MVFCGVTKIRQLGVSDLCNKTPSGLRLQVTHYTGGCMDGPSHENTRFFYRQSKLSSNVRCLFYYGFIMLDES